MSGDNLDELVARARAGDDAAFTEVVGALHGDVCAFVAVRVPHPDLIEEVANDALATAFERVADYRGGGTFRAWVKGIARNLALRRLHELRRGGEGTPTDQVEAALARRALAQAEQPLDDDAERITRLRSCVERLAPAMRELLAWRYGDDLPLTTVAQRAGRSLAGVANLLLRLRSQVRTCMERRDA